MRPEDHGVRRRAAGVAAALCVAGAVLSGCTAARSDLGTADAGCYIALPAAVRAVHRAGHLTGVRLMPVRSLRHDGAALYTVAAVRRPPVARVCLVAFHGRFSSAGVSRARGDPTGRVAVVVLDYPSNRLLGTVLFARTPLRFEHTHLGPR